MGLGNYLGKKLDSLKWKVTPKSMQRKQIDKVVGMISQYPETQFLLQLAHAEGIGIAFDKTLTGTGTSGALRGDRQTGKQYIALDPAAPVESVAVTLIHELRHVWQDKVLGITPQTRGMSEPDIETTMILNRVREADAFAFSNMMARRIELAARDEAEARGMAERLQKTTGKPPDENQLKLISEYVTEKFKSRLMNDMREMILDFDWSLQNADGYDRRALIEYHARYTSPHYETQERPEMGRPFGLGDIRKMMVLGVSPNMPPYLEGISDADFRQGVLQHMSPEIKKGMSLIDEFEKAAKRGLSGKRELEFREGLEERLHAIMKAPQVEGTKPRALS